MGLQNVFRLGQLVYGSLASGTESARLPAV